MKKNLLKIFSLALLAAFILSGCQKELKQNESQPAEEETAGRFFQRDHCRLLSDISEFGEYTYSYNERGLVDQYNTGSLNGYFKMAYDHRGRLVKSWFYSEGVLTYTIIFTYQNGRIVKDSWYLGDTNELFDETVYYYNWRGHVWKGVDALQDVISVFEYTPDGQSVKKFSFYLGGKLNFTQEFTFSFPLHKQPNSARPGLEYDFPFASGWVFASKWYSSSEKDVVYDENGENPVVLLDQDPRKTEFTVNRRNYPTAVNYFDKLTSEFVHFKFDYGNCGRDANDQVAQSSNNSAEKMGRPLSPIKLLKIGGKSAIREQLKQLRNHFTGSAPR